MIYSVDGQELTKAYAIDGTELNKGYDVDGTVIWEKEIIEPDFTFMTYNVGQWYTGIGSLAPAEKEQNYYNLQYSIINASKADIACFNEYRYTMGASGQSASVFLNQWFPYVQGQAGSSGYFGRAVASKYPITNYEIRTYNNESRYYDSCEITINEKPITIVVTHLAPHEISTRETELSQLMEYLATLDRFILCGDLNTEDCNDKNGEDYQHIIKPLLNMGYHCANNTSAFGFNVTYSYHPIEELYLCLDNVITSPNIKICTVKTDTTKFTDGLDGADDIIDHVPLIVGLKLL